MLFIHLCFPVYSYCKFPLFFLPPLLFIVSRFLLNALPTFFFDLHFFFFSTFLHSPLPRTFPLCCIILPLLHISAVSPTFLSAFRSHSLTPTPTLPHFPPSTLYTLGRSLPPSRLSFSLLPAFRSFLLSLILSNFLLFFSFVLEIKSILSPTLCFCPEYYLRGIFTKIFCQ